MPESLYQQQEYEIATLSHRPTTEELRDLRFVVVIDSTTNQTGVVGRIWEAPGSAGEPYMLVEDEQGQEELCLLNLSDDGLHLYAHSSLREAKIIVLAVSDLESRYTTEDSSDPLLITGMPLSVDISGTSDTIQGVVGITNNIADYPINIFSDGTTVYVITSAGEMVTVSSFDIVPAEGEQYRLTTIDAVELGRLIAVYSRVFTQGYEATARLLDDTPEIPTQQIDVITGDKSPWPTPTPPDIDDLIGQTFPYLTPGNLVQTLNDNFSEGETCAIIYNSAYILITKTGVNKYSCNAIPKSLKMISGFTLVTEQVGQYTVTEVIEVDVEVVSFVDLEEFFATKDATLVTEEPLSGSYSLVPLSVTAI